MSKRQEKIDLDFFKTQFEEKSHLDQGWNNPPDFVLEDAISVVNKRKNKRKNRFLYLLTFSVIIAGIILSLFNATQKVNILEEKINTLTQSSLVSDKEESKTIDNKIDVSNLQTPINPSNVDDQKTITPQAAEPKQTKAISIDKTKADRKTNNNTTQQLIIKKEASNNASTQAPIAQKAKMNVVKSYTEIIRQARPLAQLTHEVETKRITPRIYDEITFLHTNTLNQNNRISAGLFFKRNNSTFVMSAPLSSKQVLTEYDKYYAGIGIQATISIPLSDKLSLASNLSYDKISNQSITSTNLSYRIENEKLMQSGQTMYETMLYLESPVGTLEQPMLFEIDPLMIREGEIYDKTKLDQCLSIIGLNAGLTYNLINNQTIQWSAGFNLGANYISHLRSDMYSEFVFHKKMMGTNETTLESTQNVNRFFGTYGTSTGINYRIKDNIRLSFQAGYSRSLTSLRSQKNIGANTNLINWNTNLGLSKTF